MADTTEEWADAITSPNTQWSPSTLDTPHADVSQESINEPTGETTRTRAENEMPLLVLYTDGSARREKQGVAGAAVTYKRYVDGCPSGWKDHAWGISNANDANDAEILAIVKALEIVATEAKMLADRRPPSTLPPPAPALEDEEGVVNRDGGQQRAQNPKVVIITDSSHALDQIQRFLQGQPLRIRPTNALIMDALTSVLLRLLFMDSVRLEFRKVKSHAGVEGNCRADGLARAAARAMAMAMPTPWDGDGLGGSC
ncbi:hypothetical protein UCREL1_10068 [Eutypa lata UCREL1]|uniref:ribonuclease H n=1 Tax=Eutypa lata (strain UCR-EL1) TaxID=1287681 RepID=M7SFQ1_EUTLA|nr:hypothetical protein UCREL1_10068 [Eutypa lata UCREL1]